MSTEPSTIATEGRSVDAFLGGLVTLVQPKRGHRAGLDAALLQSLVPSDASGLAIDLGAGVGTVAFCVAARAPGLSAIGVEKDTDLAACGEAALRRTENAAFVKRVRLIEADATDAATLRAHPALAGRKADWVLMNPPFGPEEGQVSPDPFRRAAHQSTPGLLPSWMASADALLVPGGMLCLIHRADALPQVLAAIAGRFGGIRLWPAHPSESAPASRILAIARRGSRAPLSLMPGLVLHQANGGWTPRADAILRGKAELAA